MRGPKDKWITTPSPDWYEPMLSSGHPMPPETLRILFPGLYEVQNSALEVEVKGKGKKKKGRLNDS